MVRKRQLLPAKKALKIIIFGASGSGTTTLGKSLAGRLGYSFLDADDYYWEKTESPYQVKIPLEKRQANLRNDVEATSQVIVSGSLASWDSFWDAAFDLGIFLVLPLAIRMKRLLKREKERYGPGFETDEAILLKSKAFLDWAAKYDDPTFDGRSIRQHRDWIARMNFEVLELNGDLTNERRQQLVVDRIQKLGSK